MFRSMDHFDPKMTYPQGSLEIFFKFCTKERGQEVHKNHFNSFSQQGLVQGKMVILAQKTMQRNNYGSTLGFL